MPNQPKKNLIKSSTLLEAILATQEDFQRKSNEYNELGIKRIDDSSTLASEYDIIEKKGHGGTVISNAEIDMESKSFSITDFKDHFLPAIIFENCSIRHLYILNSSLSSSKNSYTSIYFLSSQVKQISVNNSKVGTLEFRNSHSNHSISIKGGSTIGGIRILEESRINQINISQKSQAQHVLITDKSKITHVFTVDDSIIGNFNIEKASKTGRFTITNQSIAGWFNINGSSQTDDIKVQDSKIRTFNLRENSKIGDFEIVDNSETDWIKIYEQSKTGDIIITDESQTGDIQITRSTIDSFTAVSLIASIAVKSSIIESMKIEESYIPSFLFKDQSKTEAFIHNCKINLLDFNHNIVSQDTNLSFSSTQIYCCLMEQLSVLGCLYFRDVTALKDPFSLPERATPKRTTNYNKHKEVELAQSYGINRSLFLVTYSSLGETEFIDSDLQSFSDFKFAHSRITEIFVSGLKAPSKNLQIKGLEKNTIEWHEQFVSFYNQFSTVFEKQGFIYNSVNYRSKSALNQQKILFKKWISILDLFSNSQEKVDQNLDNRFFAFLEYLPFWFNRWSNNHGKSWGRALIFFVITSVIMYVWYLLSIGHVFKFNRDINLAFIGYYFEFINPFRPFSFLEQVEFSNNYHTRIVDFFSRVVIGYGVYQFLTAFRKYKKK